MKGLVLRLVITALALWVAVRLVPGIDFTGSALALLLDWQYGVLLIGPIAGVACILSFFFIRPYPLGKPSPSKA